MLAEGGLQWEGKDNDGDFTLKWSDGNSWQEKMVGREDYLRKGKEVRTAEWRYRRDDKK